MEALELAALKSQLIVASHEIPLKSTLTIAQVIEI